MHEATATPRTKAAIEAAHAERSAVLRQLIRALIGPRVFPLNQAVLTGSSRCPN